MAWLRHSYSIHSTYVYPLDVLNPLDFLCPLYVQYY